MMRFCEYTFIHSDEKKPASNKNHSENEKLADPGCQIRNSTKKTYLNYRNLTYTMFRDNVLSKKPPGQILEEIWAIEVKEPEPQKETLNLSDRDSLDLWKKRSATMVESTKLEKKTMRTENSILLHIAT